MATDEQHLQQFERNTAVAQKLSESADYEWAVIALFYAGLHLVQAYLVRGGIDAKNHSQRNREIMRNEEMRAVHESYRALRDDSEYARYECGRFSQQEFEEIRGGTFNRIVTHVQALMEKN